MKHTVYEADCTGCRLCLPVCPVDCIETVASTEVEDPEKRAMEVRQLVLAKQSRQAAGLARQLAGVEERLEKQLPETTLPAELQEKVDAARRAAQDKWQHKKAAPSRGVARKERGN
jgi:electron transport complex protein RnfB